MLTKICCAIVLFAAPAAAESIVLGAIIEMTGRSALAGEQERRGIALALEDLNANGRRHFEGVFEDNASNNAGTVNALNKLAGRGDVVAFLGPLRSTQLLAILGRINEIGIPAMTGGTNESITKQGSPWIFRVRTDDGLGLRLGALYAVETIGARRIAILHDSDAFGAGAMHTMTNALRDMYGIAPILVEKYHAGDRDFTGQLLAARNAGSDLLIVFGTRENDAGLILRRYRQLGLRYNFLGSAAFGTSIVLALAGGEAEGVHIMTDFTPERPSPATQEYRARYRQRYGEDPDLIATHAYDAFLVMGRAVEHAGTNPQALRRALHELHTVGASGEFHFDAEGNGRHDMAFVTIHGSRHEKVEILDSSALAHVTRLPAGSVPPPPKTAAIATAFQLVAEGIALGAVYALVALGFVLLYNCASLVNFAQGELVMIGGFLFATFAPRWGPWIALAAVIVLMAALSVVFRRATYEPIAEQSARDFTPFVVTTIGASIFLKNLARLIWGAHPALPESPFGRGSTEFAGVFVPFHEAGTVAVTVAILALLYVLFQKTMLGIRLRATAQDRDTASLMGIPVRQMVALSFAGACMLAGIGGALLAPVYFVQPEMGGMFSLKAFAASIAGGFGSIPGAIVGGLLLGVIETLTGAYVSQAFRDGIAFVLIIAVLVFRPSGLFGEKAGDRG